MNELLAGTVAVVGTMLLVAVVGAYLLYRLRRTSLRRQLLLASLIPLVAVSVAVAIAVTQMLLTSRAPLVVAVPLALALIVAAAGAWWVARSVRSGFALLDEQVRGLVADSEAPAALATMAPTSGDRPAPAPPGPSGPSAPEPAAELPVDLPVELREALTALTAARRTLADARERQWAAERARRELVSFMSHDLRTPLAGLRALVEALEDGIVDDVPRAYAQLQSMVARLGLLVDDLFALSRVSASPKRGDRAPVSLAEVILEVGDLAAPAARSAGVGLEVAVRPGDRLAVHGSHADLSRALGNLVDNAVRHTARGSRVRIEAGRTAAGAVQVEVADQCGGIPEPHLARVFDTGWRGNAARSPADGGAGLGLAIALGVAESHAGRIEVRNTDDGCAFALELPSTAVPAPG